MDRARDQIEASGAKLVLIGQASARQAAHFRRTQKISLPVLADEQRESYAAAGARMASIGELLGPKVIAKGISTMIATGRMQGRTIGNPAQLGGAVVIAPGGHVVWEKMAADPSDNAPPEEILAAVRSAAQAS